MPINIFDKLSIINVNPNSLNFCIPCKNPRITGTKKANIIELPRIIKGIITFILRNEDNKGLTVRNKMLIIIPSTPIFFNDPKKR